MSQLSNLLVVFVWFVWVGWMVVVVVVVVVVVAWTILNSQDPRLWISPPKKKHLGRGSHCWESQEKSPNNPPISSPQIVSAFSYWQALDILEATLWEAYTQAVQLGVKVGSGFKELKWDGDQRSSQIYGEIWGILPEHDSAWSFGLLVQMAPGLLFCLKNSMRKHFGKSGTKT